jgi:hypothetical protein
MASDAAIGALLVRALTKPVNLLPAAVAIAIGLAAGLWWLILVGALYYVAMATTSFFSPAEARRVVEARRREPGSAQAPPPGVPAGLRDPAIRRRYEEAIAEEHQIRRAIEDSVMPVDDVVTELVGLKDEIEALCLRAQRVSDYLGSVDLEELRRRRTDVERQRVGAPDDLQATLARTGAALEDQIGTVETLGRQLERFHAESLGIVSTLGAIRGQVVRVSVSDTGDAEERVRDQLGDARQLVRVLTDELQAPAIEG